MRQTQPATTRDIPAATVLLVACVIASVGELALRTGKQINRVAIWAALKMAGM